MPGQRRDVLVAALGGVGAQRVDADDVRAVLLRLEHEAPLVQVRREQVRAPEDHELRPPMSSGSKPTEAPIVERSAALAAAVQIVSPQARGAKGREEARARRPALDDAHRAREVVGQHGLRPVAVDRASDAGGRELERLVPGDPLEAPFALGADPPLRVRQPVGAVESVEVVVDLAAERAPGERVLADAAQADRPAVFHGDVPGARVRAVQRAGAAHDLGGH